MTHILCGTDFTEGAGWAWQRAVLVARANECALKLLHIVEDDSAQVDQPRDEALARLAAEGSERDLRVEGRIVHGVPGDVLASEGERNGCRLVVLGPRSKKDLITWLLGSTAERVIRRCRTPVLAVHQPAMRRYRRALASLDFESASRQALEAALTLELVPDGGLAVAHAFFAPLRRAVGLADIPVKTEEEHVQEVGNEALATAIATINALGWMACVYPPLSVRVTRGR